MKRPERGALRSAVWIVCRGVAVVLLSGMAGAALVRFAPGFGVDERALDPRLSAHGLAAIEREHKAEQNPFTFYIHFLRRTLQGDAGQSVVFRQPVGQLILARAPVTIFAASLGLFLGWSAALACAILAALSRHAAVPLTTMAISGSLLSVPSAVLATICLLLRVAPAIPIAAIVFPRVFPHAYEQLRASLTAPHVLMARAKGLPFPRLFLFHVLSSAWMPLVALAGVSVNLAFGASIPIEALADTPGLGQMAWRAALGRDMPVLVSITLLLTVITVAANVVADLAQVRSGSRAE